MKSDYENLRRKAERLREAHNKAQDAERLAEAKWQSAAQAAARARQRGVNL